MSSTTTYSAGSIPRRADNVETAPRISEDWLSLIVGLLIFGLALAGIANVDLLGWTVTTSVWTDIAKALGPVSKTYASFGGFGRAGRHLRRASRHSQRHGVRAQERPQALRARLHRRCSGSLTRAGSSASYANFAAVTPAELQKFGISWSLKLTTEGGYIFALLAGLIIANFFPRFADSIKAAGCAPSSISRSPLSSSAALLPSPRRARLNLASSLLLRGIAASSKAYLIYWAVVYFVARKWFGFNREWAAPLASGISICGVAASIATGSAIRARPAIPVLVSSLVVIFAVVEVLILPFLAQTFLWREPLVAGAWIGLAVKTDGAAVAGGGHHRGVDPRQERGRRHQVSARLDSGDDGHREDLHRHLHRHLGLHPRATSGPTTSTRPQPTRRRGVGDSGSASRSSSSGFSPPRRSAPTSCSGHRRRSPPRCRPPSARQHLPRALLHPDVLLDRRALELPPAMAGGHRQARGRLCHQPVRLRDLGRPLDLLALLQRPPSATGQLTG
ncbi:MAG: putative sulfate exporter family transporter [Pseudolabrys sp.]